MSEAPATLTTLPLIRRLVGMAALAGFLTATAIHVASLRGIDVEAMFADVWMLHYAAMAFVLFASVSTSILVGPGRNFGAFISVIPLWARLAILAALAYAVWNFVNAAGLSAAGEPIVQNGRYAFNDHGTLREVSEAEFHALRAATMRLFSGHWVLLYLFSALYLLTGRPVRAR